MAKTFQLNKPEYGPKVDRLLQAGGTRRQMERLQALRRGRWKRAPGWKPGTASSSRWEARVIG